MNTPELKAGQRVTINDKLIYTNQDMQPGDVGTVLIVHTAVAVATVKLDRTGADELVCLDALEPMQ